MASIRQDMVVWYRAILWVIKIVLPALMCFWGSSVTCEAQIAFQRHLDDHAMDVPTVPAFGRLPSTINGSMGVQRCDGGGSVMYFSRTTYSQSVVRFTPQGTSTPLYLMYVHGIDSRREGAFIAMQSTDGRSWCALNGGQSVIPNSFSFQGQPYTNGTAVVYADPDDSRKQAVFFFFQTKTADATMQNLIGVAISRDGVNFVQTGRCGSTGPIVDRCGGGQALTAATVLPQGPGEPFAIVGPTDGNLYLFSRHSCVATKDSSCKDHEVRYAWAMSDATTGKGLNFSTPDGHGLSWPYSQDMFGPSFALGSFDEYGISGVRLLLDDGFVYLIYGGAPKRDDSLRQNTGENCTDYPEGLGLARIRAASFPGDRYDNPWNRYRHNPTLLRSAAGTWSDGAMWSGSLLRIGNEYRQWYEATGTDAKDGNYSSINRFPDQVASNARSYCYGGFGNKGDSTGAFDAPFGGTSFLQVGMATMKVGSRQSLDDLWKTDVPSTGSIKGLPSSPGCLAMESPSLIDESYCSGNQLSQTWTFMRQSSGFFRIRNGSVGSSGLLTANTFANIADASPTYPGSPSNLKLSGQPEMDYGSASADAIAAQEWWIVPSGSMFSFVNRSSSFTLSISMGSQQSASQQLPWKAGNTQQWSVGP